MVKVERLNRRRGIILVTEEAMVKAILPIDKKLGVRLNKITLFRLTDDKETELVEIKDAKFL